MASFTNNGANILATKDANVPVAGAASTSGSVASDGQKDMEYHRQVLKSKMEAQQYVIQKPLHQQQQQKDFSSSDVGCLPCANRSGNNYISPSDEIMSPCTAKLNALRNKQVGKYVSIPPHFTLRMACLSMVIWRKTC